MQDLDEMNIEIMRNTLYKAYLDDFAQFCQRLGGITAEIMSDLLAFEVGYELVSCAGQSSSACAGPKYPLGLHNLVMSALSLIGYVACGLL